MPATGAPLDASRVATGTVADVVSQLDDKARRAPTSRLSWWIERFALLVVWLVVVGIFGAIEPSTFLTVGNLANILGSNTVIFVVMMAALIPLRAGDFDLSVAAVSGLVSVVVASLNVNQGLPILAACGVGIGIGVIVGCVNAVAVIVFRNDSFIVTLGTGTVITGIAFAASGANTIAGVSGSLVQWIFSNTLFGIPLEFYYALALLCLLWYLWEMTPLGQRILFVGTARRVAKLSGVAVGRIRAASFVGAGVVAALSGVLYLGTTGSADATTSASFLLPAFAAAFLGTTCIKPGRFNAVGGGIAVFFLSTGVAGLQLMGVQNYVQQLFYGGALVLAVTIAQVVGRRRSEA